MKSGGQGIIVPDEEVARQAIASIGGYAYQLLASADAWLSLDGDDALLVEIAEDYAVVAGNALKAVQVKRTSGSVTLRTSSVIKAINAFWRFQSANTDMLVHSVYLTTSSIGREQAAHFPENMPGLLLWKEAIDDPVRLLSLRQFLSSLPLTKNLSAWLATASDDEVCHRLLSRVHWQCAAPSFNELESRIRGRMKVRCEVFGILPTESRRATDAMLFELLKIAASSSDRILRRSQLTEIIERSTTCAVPAATMRKALASEGRAALGNVEVLDEYHPPLTLREHEGDDRLFFFAAEGRVPLVGRAHELSALRGWLAGSEKLSWTLVTGPGGSGKSRLALELCIFARANGWRAGFLYGGSEAATATQFMKFRSSEPTLIVWDYVIEAPEKARKLIDTFISLHEMGALRRSVRVLLIERNKSDIGWWPKFSTGHSGRLKHYGRRLGAEDTFLALNPLDEHDLREIVEHVIGQISDSEEVLDDLKKIDPLGRPLFAALAADAFKNGKPASKLSQQGLLNDIINREQQRWRVLSRDPLDLERHEHALALATMVGGLTVPDGTQNLPLDVFPFSSECFNPALMEAMTGGVALTTKIPPIEPDILGEWFVLQKLVPQHPFDQRPDQLTLAAELRATLSVGDAANLGTFRSRAAEDFPDQVTRTKLFRPPVEGAPEHTFVEWASSMSSSFEYLCSGPHAADAFSEIRKLIPVLRTSDEYQLAAGDAYFSYAMVLATNGQYREAKRIFLETLDWALERADLSELATKASTLGEALGRSRLERGESQEAIGIFGILLTFAQRIKLDDGGEKDEVADNAASLGLAIRQQLIQDGDREGARILNNRLWERPASNRSIDLSSNAGTIMMQRNDLGPANEILLELKARSLARPDVQALGFWVAHVGYGIVRHASNNQDFVDAIRDLADWLSPRADWPDMMEVVYDAIDNQWITEDYGLGRKPIEALFELWSAAVSTAIKRGGEVERDNELGSIRQQIEEALSLHGRLPWVNDLRRRIRLVEKSKLPRK